MTAHNENETRTSGGNRMLARLGINVLGVLATLLVFDVVLRLAVPRTGLLRQVVDIQTPSVLYTKLAELQHFEGIKIVVLGDSLVFGRTMRDHGDGEWQAHTLASEIEREVVKASPGRPLMVANLGMNGTLPSDLDNLVRIVTPLKPDLIIFDLSLRSFSRDFERAADSQTRPWLADLTVSPDMRYATTANESGFGRKIRDLAVNTWYFYRLKDFFQALAFDGQPSAYLIELRNRLDTWLKRGANKASAGQDDPLDSILLNMKASARYSNIDLASDNPQFLALRRLLARLAAAGQPALAFYATENMAQLNSLIAREAYDKLQGQLSTEMATAAHHVRYFGPLPIFEPKNYLDHVHLDKVGYQRLAAHLVPAIQDILSIKPGN